MLARYLRQFAGGDTVVDTSETVFRRASPFRGEMVEATLWRFEMPR
jgi:hypothetical protein